MKTLIITLALLVIATSAQAGYVRGHYRSNGTYVDSYYRTAPDGVKWNNKSEMGW